jgi:hypothetical protein
LIVASDKTLVLATVLSLLGLSALVDQGQAQENPLKEMCSISVTHDCEMLSLPEPTYPQVTEAGDADCAVEYRVMNDGTVEVIKAVCSDARFVDSAIQGMSTVRYKVKDVCGRACPTIGRTFEYPLVYRLEE